MLFTTFKTKRTLGKIYNKGQIIFTQHEEGNSLFSVIDGSVALVLNTPAKTVRIALLKQNDIFGIPHLFGRETRYCTAIVTENNTNVITLDKKLLLTRMYTDPGLMYTVCKMLNDRLMAIVDHCPCECDEFGECEHTL